MAERPLHELAADAIEPARLHAAFGLAFADYLIGPFVLSPEQWPQFLTRQGVDLGLSRVLCRGDELLAFALVAPRAGLLLPRWRLATMGAVPAARGSGAAPRLLDGFVQRAREAGMAEVELEVFAQNERALKLYRGRGFEVLHELHGYRAPPLGGPAQAPAGLLRLDRQQAFDWIDTEALLRLADLPLQVTPVALAASTSFLQGWQQGSALLLFSQLDAQTLAIASLIDWQPEQQDARALLQRLRAAYPQQEIRVPQLQRLDCGGQALRDCGFAPLPLHQLLMRAATSGAQ